MTRLDTNSISLLYPLDDHMDTGLVRRLLVLVPAQVDYTSATHRLWELARAFGCNIFFLSLCTDPAQEASLRRQLIMMSAMVHDGKVFAEARVEMGTNWVSAVRSYLQADDMIVCLTEQRIGFLHRPLHEILKTNLDVPVYILSDPHPHNSKQDRFSQIVMWLGFLAIVIGSGFLQVKIAQLTQGWLQTVLLVVSTLNEFWLIWVWSRLYD